MVKRIAVDTSRFKVSKPTINVDAASDTQLLFDGFGAPYAGVVISGQTATNDGSWGNRSISPFIWTGSGWYFDAYNATRIYKEISFPTQTVPPDVLIMAMPIGDQSFATPHYSHVNQYGSRGDGWAGTAVWASTTTNKLTLRVDYSTFGADGYKDWKIAYLVFQNFQHSTIKPLYE